MEILKKKPILVMDEHVNSDFLNGLNKEEAISQMIAWLEEKEIGTKKVTYRLT